MIFLSGTETTSRILVTTSASMVLHHEHGTATTTHMHNRLVDIIINQPKQPYATNEPRHADTAQSTPSPYWTSKLMRGRATTSKATNDHRRNERRRQSF